VSTAAVGTVVQTPRLHWAVDGSARACQPNSGYYVASNYYRATCLISYPNKQSIEIVRKEPTFAKVRQIALHATSGAPWCLEKRVVSLLATCRSFFLDNGGERKIEEGGLSYHFPFIFYIWFMKMKYIKNRKSKLQTVFTFFEILVSISSKLDSILLCLEKFVPCTSNTSIVILVVCI
jgi:hypothetical protein